jgi:hypothetical protein
VKPAGSDEAGNRIPTRAILLEMPANNNPQTPNLNPGWFSSLSRRTQALLLSLLMLACSAGTFLMGMHGLHSGEKLVTMAGKSDWSDDFFWSAGTFVLGACLLAVALGWKPKGSEIQPPK